jgi:hypothetical protein
VRRLIEGMIIVAVAALAGCATTQPPERIQGAIATMNRHMPEYVAEANEALETSGHPDAERLTGMGTRLRDGLATLDQWAQGEVEGEAE